VSAGFYAPADGSALQHRPAIETGGGMARAARRCQQQVSASTHRRARRFLHHAPICAPTVRVANASLPTPSASLTGIKHGLDLLKLTNFTFFYKFGEKLTEALTRYSLLPFRSASLFSYSPRERRAARLRRSTHKTKLRRANYTHKER
jgi:hypothetical protein